MDLRPTRLSVMVLVATCGCGGRIAHEDVADSEATPDVSTAPDTSLPPDTSAPDTAMVVDTTDTSIEQVDSTVTDVIVDETLDAGEKCSPADGVEDRPCGRCGSQSRLCADGWWQPWGKCSGETGECVPKDTSYAPCGKCGTGPRVCLSDCTWSVGGPCTGGGVCAPTDVETKYETCPDGGITSSMRTCSSSCTWGDFSPWTPC